MQDLSTLRLFAIKSIETNYLKAVQRIWPNLINVLQVDFPNIFNQKAEVWWGKVDLYFMTWIFQSIETWFFLNTSNWKLYQN